MADKPNDFTNPNPEADPDSGDNTSAFVAALMAPLAPLAKYKPRSHETSKTTHLPLLQRQQRPPTIVLLGDSMVERMTTTGESPNLVAPWPSAAMLPDSELPAGTGRLHGVLNAGVGGDKVQNIAYRLVGERHPEDGEKDLAGLLEALVGCGPGRKEGVKLWVVQAGTNNLSVKKGLVDTDRDAFQVVLRALKDVARELVDEANKKLMDMVKGLNHEAGMDRVVFLPATDEVKTEEHLVDHVHLSLDGYRVWMRKLFPAVVGLLKEMEEESS
ncbi:Platelet-activating factor acetylhydrolase IB subunit gamma [Madurella mycetomatis]|uniref:Platelet-activating factor acetylhydrolase IB subunit gamma n=1 Tax=Madurella mycetomatis TaxID=100816 RepID=A0A175W414_9PEZI|nr:Platelet-activating factor acetylhydrolase IB subunit gamma [Madurella mycetomatis]